MGEVRNAYRLSADNPLLRSWEKDSEESRRTFKQSKVETGEYLARLVRTVCGRFGINQQECVRLDFRIADGREVYKLLYTTENALKCTIYHLKRIGITDHSQLNKDIPGTVSTKITVAEDKYKTGFGTIVDTFQILDVDEGYADVEDFDRTPSQEQVTQSTTSLDEKTPDAIAMKNGWSKSDLDDLNRITSNQQ